MATVNTIFNKYNTVLILAYIVVQIILLQLKLYVPSLILTGSFTGFLIFQTVTYRTTYSMVAKKQHDRFMADTLLPPTPHTIPDTATWYPLPGKKTKPTIPEPTDKRRKKKKKTKYDALLENGTVVKVPSSRRLGKAKYKTLDEFFGRPSNGSTVSIPRPILSINTPEIQLDARQNYNYTQEQTRMPIVPYTRPVPRGELQKEARKLQAELAKSSGINTSNTTTRWQTANDVEKDTLRRVEQFKQSRARQPSAIDSFNARKQFNTKGRPRHSNRFNNAESDLLKLQEAALARVKARGKQPAPSVNVEGSAVNKKLQESMRQMQQDMPAQNYPIKKMKQFQINPITNSQSISNSLQDFDIFKKYPPPRPPPPPPAPLDPPAPLKEQFKNAMWNIQQKLAGQQG